jgi:hypothetical protein
LPNNQETKVAVYVEYFQGSLPAVQALNGIPMPRECFSIEIIDVTRTAFYFGLPRALKAGKHSISFWSGDNDPMSFTFTALDALTPRLKYIFPTQGTTKGGDSISITIENYDAIGDVSVFLGKIQQTRGPAPATGYLRTAQMVLLHISHSVAHLLSPPFQ